MAADMTFFFAVTGFGLGVAAFVLWILYYSRSWAPTNFIVSTVSATATLPNNACSTGTTVVQLFNEATYTGSTLKLPACKTGTWIDLVPGPTNATNAGSSVAVHDIQGNPIYAIGDSVPSGSAVYLDNTKRLSCVYNYLPAPESNLAWQCLTTS